MVKHLMMAKNEIIFVTHILQQSPLVTNTNKSRLKACINMVPEGFNHT
jgi:hypothetical protein